MEPDGSKPNYTISQDQVSITSYIRSNELIRMSFNRTFYRRNNRQLCVIRAERMRGLWFLSMSVLSILLGRYKSDTFDYTSGSRPGHIFTLDHLIETCQIETF